MRKGAEDPLALLQSTSHFLGRPLDLNDPILVSLLTKPTNSSTFIEMMLACLNAIIEVLERQYSKYFQMDITDKLKKETSSARAHNIDAEQVMGMFSAGKERAKNATIDFLAGRMKARKNKVVPYLDSMSEAKRERVISWAVRRGRQKRALQKQKQGEVKKELSRQTKMKRQKKTEARQLERRLKAVDIGEANTLLKEILNNRERYMPYLV